MDDQINQYSDENDINPVNRQIQMYNEIYDSVLYQYNLLISKVEKKIRGILDNKLIKKIKYASQIADIWGYCIITVNKTDKNDMNIYNPSEIRLYKKKQTSLDSDNFIFGKIETDGTNQKLKILNYQYNCYVLSLDPMVMMPIPNIVKISQYLYLLDLVEILMIYNDLIKSKTVHLLEIPVFDSNAPSSTDDAATTTSIMDNIQIMNMIINNIENKLVMDTDYIKGSGSSEDAAIQVLKNVGLSVAYVPKLSPNSDMKDIRLDTDDNQYQKLYTLLNEKIFGVLKFPLQFKTSSQLIETFKSIPREVVQFAHLVFMSRVSSTISELEAFLEQIICVYSDEFNISYYGSDSVFPIEFEGIKIKIRSTLGEYLFDNQRAETTRQTRIQNILTLTSSGYALNPHWMVEYAFPEYTIGDVLLDVGSTLETKRQELSNAISGNVSQNISDSTEEQVLSSSTDNSESNTEATKDNSKLFFDIGDMKKIMSNGKFDKNILDLILSSKIDKRFIKNKKLDAMKIILKNT